MEARTPVFEEIDPGVTATAPDASTGDASYRIPRLVDTTPLTEP